VSGTPGSNQDIYSGAFAYTSPPNRVMLSDHTNQSNISPFQTKQTILQFNSASKSVQKRKSAKKSATTNKNDYKFKINKSDKLLDFQIKDKIFGFTEFGNGIFKTDDTNNSSYF
jgi:hypothetical protein